MKKILLSVTLGVFLIGFFACGGGSSEKVAMEKMVKVFEDYVNDLEKAESADDVVAALDKCSKGMKELEPEMKALKEKYKDANFMTSPPKDLEDVSKKLGEVMGRMATASMKMMKYATDPKVQEAQKRYTEAMASWQ